MTTEELLKAKSDYKYGFVTEIKEKAFPKA